ncbi:MAG: class I SAM-dependent methyltransferase [Proteobacteria bacterium]|nr:class I SAM-dependent methyltransferase [Pseudomonadota bacterium]
MNVQSMSVKPVSSQSVPSQTELVGIIEASGSGEAEFFGYPEVANGLYLQQDPEEFASFVHFMATKIPPAKLTLDIGIASGGQTKFLRDYFSAEKTIVVDLGEHPLFPHWERIKKGVNSKIILEIIGDSHAESTREKLLPYANQVDFAFVDGDHSYRGLRQDIFLTKELLKLNGYMALHDTSAVADCRQVYDDLLSSRDFTLVRNYHNRFGISIWKRINNKRKPNFWNRRFGIGKI